MKAVIISAVNQMSVAEMPAPVPRESEVVISLHAAALNHRDVWIRAGEYAGLKYPCVPGSDGAGVVTETGRNVDRSWLEREVVINPSFDWGIARRAQGPQFSILGLPRDGTLAEEISVPVAQLSAKPAHLSWTEAAALPLAGLTAYRALFTRAALQPGERVLLSGIGGGVALLALQFAVAHGAQVWVTSSSPEKIARAVALGAKGGFLYTNESWVEEAKKTSGLFDVIIDSAGGPTFSRLIDAAAPGGRLAFFGATAGDPTHLPMRKVFWRQLSLLGSTMGGPEDWTAMIDFVNRHRIKPIISDVFPLEKAPEAFDLMERGGQFGKIVLTIWE